MAPRRGHLQGALHVVLSLHVGEVGVVRRCRAEQRLPVHRRDREIRPALHEADDLLQRRRAAHLQAVHHGGFRHVRLGEHDPRQPALPRMHGDGQSPPDRPERPVQAQLAHQTETVQPLHGVHLPRARQDAHGDRQVEGAAALGDVERRQGAESKTHRQLGRGVLRLL